jgi:hypothetical protein
MSLRHCLSALRRIDLRRQIHKMSFYPAYNYIEADQLAAILKDPQEKAKTAVVDVRGRSAAVKLPRGAKRRH